jgi:acyl phosphate:glycerol-3-phosphate acyltransferase
VQIRTPSMLALLLVLEYTPIETFVEGKDMVNYGIWTLIAYLLGSISSAIVVCKLFNLPDPRTQGSGNPGATNVARIAGKKLAAVVLLGDALKGFIPVYMVHLLFNEPFLTSLVALAAFIGHLYPIFFKFQGGKGVATAFGGLLGFSWPIGGIFAATWLLALAMSRISSTSAIAAMAMATFFSCLFYGFIISAPILVMCAMLLWRHWDNILRIQSGTEPRIDR